MTVPMILLSGPLVGLVLGMWLDRRLRTAPWLTAIGVVLGCLSSGREAYRIIRRIDQEGRRERSGTR